MTDHLHSWRRSATTLANTPENESFRQPYITYLHVLRHDGTSGTRRQAERELAKLQQ